LKRYGIPHRSKKETVRLHQLNKPVRKAVEDDLPSIHSHDEDEESWSSGIDDDGLSIPNSASDEISGASHGPSPDNLDSDAEMPYETAPRKGHPSWDSDDNTNIHHLPTKLPDGRIQKSVSKPTIVHAANKPNDESDDDAEDHDQTGREESYRVEDVSTGARFGRPAVVDIIGNKSRKARIQGAKDQIAGICQEIIADPENSVRTYHNIAINVLILLRSLGF
jgi:nucleolar complex protein 3